MLQNLLANTDVNPAAGFLGGTIALVFYIGLYLVVAVSLMTIANKTSTPNGWFAFIPILNIVLMVQIAQKPIWWVILFFIPCVNIVAVVMTWMAIAEARNKPSWMGILMIVPCANLIVPLYIAFAD